MHIVLGLLGAIITILILLNRLSDGRIDIGWLNPFAWRRRRAWRKRYQANPIFTMDDPMEVTALLAVAIARSDGDMSAEQKQGLQQLLSSEFNVEPRKAAALMNSSAFLLRDGEAVKTNIDKLLQPSASKFSKEQLASASSLLDRVALLEGPVSPLQQELLTDIKRVWSPQIDPPSSTW